MQSGPDLIRQVLPLHPTGWTFPSSISSIQSASQAGMHGHHQASILLTAGWTANAGQAACEELPAAGPSEQHDAAQASQVDSHTQQGSSGPAQVCWYPTCTPDLHASIVLELPGIGDSRTVLLPCSNTIPRKGHTSRPTVVPLLRCRLQLLWSRSLQPRLLLCLSPSFSHR